MSEGDAQLLFGVLRDVRMLDYALASTPKMWYGVALIYIEVVII